MWSELHHEAVEIQEQMISRNKVAILNLVSDSTSAVSLFAILLQVPALYWSQSAMMIQITHHAGVTP